MAQPNGLWDGGKSEPEREPSAAPAPAPAPRITEDLVYPVFSPSGVVTL